MRIPAIDCAKTIGIALVVFGHISGPGDCNALVFARNLVTQFHVPLFFFLSGFCFKAEDSWRVFLAKRIKGLYLPFVIWNLVFFLIHLVAHRMNGEVITTTDTVKNGIKILCGYAISPLGGASWFLITLFLTLFLYKFLLSLFSKCRYALLLTLLVSLALSILGTQIILPWGHEKTLVALFFVAAGHLTRSSHLLEQINPRLSVLLILLGIIIVWHCAQENRPSMALHQYGSIPVYYIAALCGTFTTILSCLLLVRINALRFLIDWGQKTIWVLLGHFAAFKLVLGGQILLFDQPWNTILLRPCNYIGGVWLPIYFITGFFLPILFSKLPLINKLP